MINSSIAESFITRKNSALVRNRVFSHNIEIKQARRINVKHNLLLFIISILLMQLSAIHAQDVESCETYDLITVNTSNFVDAELDIRTLRCTTILVVNEDRDIVDVFVIAESTVGSYLRGADLSGQDITDIDFSFANLRSAILTDIMAEQVMFIDTDFTGADLSASQLSYAYFNFATLNNASLVDANLQGAELSETKMRDTDLTGANLDGAIGYEPD